MTGPAMVCPKCGGKVIEEADEPYCINCGFVDYGTVAERDADIPAGLAAELAEAEVPAPAGQAEDGDHGRDREVVATTFLEAKDPQNSANDQPGDPDPDNQATQNENGPPVRCKTCKHIEVHDDRYYCGSRICPGRLPIATRPPYWIRHRESLNKRRAEGPDADPWKSLTEAEKTVICRHAREYGYMAAGVKFGVPWQSIRAYMAGEKARANRAREPEAGQADQRQAEAGQDQAGQAGAAEIPQDRPGDSFISLLLPAWCDDWPLDIKIPWLQTARGLYELSKKLGGNI